ncbi:MAG: hypothetical protein KAG53_06350 [Endozoicomonadaceae bacterium]|nr:hypothetical protein [Endozoicomonadaceae bacterium]
MNNSIDISALSFREKLSYINNSATHTGVFTKVLAVFRLIVNCGTYKLHITRENCDNIMKLNNECIFSRKIIALHKLSEESNPVYKQMEIDLESTHEENEKLREAIKIAEDRINVVQNSLIEEKCNLLLAEEEKEKLRVNCRFSLDNIFELQKSIETLNEQLRELTDGKNITNDNNKVNTLIVMT